MYGNVVESYHGNGYFHHMSVYQSQNNCCWHITNALDAHSVQKKAAGFQLLKHVQTSAENISYHFKLQHQSRVLHRGLLHHLQFTSSESPIVDTRSYPKIYAIHKL